MALLRWGVFSSDLGNVPVSSTSGFVPVPEAQRDLLPIPLSLAKIDFQKHVSQPDAGEVTLSALGVLAALNFLHGVGWSEAPILPALVHPLDSGQIRTL